MPAIGEKPISSRALSRAESLAHRAPRPGFDEDDETLGQSLVSGGLEEAAHDQMLEARREGHETDET